MPDSCTRSISFFSLRRSIVPPRGASEPQKTASSPLFGAEGRILAGEPFQQLAAQVASLFQQKGPLESNIALTAIRSSFTEDKAILTA
jgi:hypothetical protein